MTIFEIREYQGGGSYVPVLYVKIEGYSISEVERLASENGYRRESYTIYTLRNDEVPLSGTPVVEG